MEVWFALRLPAGLADLGLRLASAVPTSAGLERQFSRLRQTYGLLRGRLGVEKCGKLGLLFQLLNKD